jgi:hypothetical protein
MTMASSASFKNETASYGLHTSVEGSDSDDKGQNGTNQADESDDGVSLSYFQFLMNLFCSKCVSSMFSNIFCIKSDDNSI